MAASQVVRADNMERLDPMPNPVPAAGSAACVGMGKTAGSVARQ